MKGSGKALIDFTEKKITNSKLEVSGIWILNNIL